MKLVLMKSESMASLVAERLPKKKVARRVHQRRALFVPLDADYRKGN